MCLQGQITFSKLLFYPFPREIYAHEMSTFQEKVRPSERLSFIGSRLYITNVHIARNLQQEVVMAFQPHSYVFTGGGFCAVGKIYTPIFSFFSEKSCQYRDFRGETGLK